MPLSRTMWNEAEQLREEAIKSDFIQGIASGTLNPSLFGGYMVQQSVFCSKVKDLVKEAADKADEGNVKDTLKVIAEEYESRATMLDRKWHIKNLDGIQLNDEVAEYAKYLTEVATDMPTIYFIVCLAADARLRNWIGKQINGFRFELFGKFGVYKEWVSQNLNPASNSYEILDEFINARDTLGHIDKHKAIKVYNNVMRHETDFYRTIDE